MTTPNNLSRRLFLQRAAVGTLLATGGSTLLAACATGGSDDSGSGGGGADKTADNPFGMADKSTVDAVIFNGGYGYDYVTFAANLVQQKHAGSTVKVAPSTEIAQQLQPRFVGGNPPDLIDNSGKAQIGFGTILDQLATLDDVFEANNYEGTKIADTLYPGAKDPGTYDGKFVAMNYVLTLYGLWYSESLFKENGWELPKTYDALLDLGAKAKAKGKYLFVWGKEAATYYHTLAVDSAIKEGGDEVRLALGNLEANCWSQPQIQGVFKAMETMVKNGYFVPGGAGTQFTAAQAKWSNDQQAILYPSGSWIENEMKKATKSGFAMKGIPEPTLTDSPKLPYEALRSAAGEPFIVPSKGKNVAGGKELLRAMLSKEAATNFAKTRLAPTIVKGLVPADGFGSTALQSQIAMLDAAGTNIFDYQFVGLYGMNTDNLVVWNSFLSGQLDAAGLTKGLQQITDKVRNDSSVKKIPVTK
ncbi:carbohydrate ABC transporter, N-acetylglucosamine/diacetylchitobiose-binding protein [Kribbella pittospori]|uniref:Carbohydrate ABC transporter, N-acetylglucosamine/diacetylchitobiose-binding protein n=1 Tax=Kribbella pittospori TaxID=722689 RepID=A0A4V6N4Z6_9ACTN|nr:N-acetylglucosamine/diacetylchitobiose ABC transporter substrate-binding protein [Kribbella pittospori]TCC64372.1 carbohydrate ABC transporter, N-acetylglucosamine/diacetylchitobiose-binding protein [Kribbella pittospori]